MQLPASEALVPELVVLASSPSTNAELASRVRRSALAGFTTVVTDDQTAGRGRLDRSWIAPAGSALAISVLIDPGPLPPERLGWLPIAAGVAMAGVVADLLPDAAVGFKWPNDVLVGGRKVCGVLAELIPERGAVVVGAGINTAMTAEQLPVLSATSLAIEGLHPDADTVLAGYLTRLRGLVEPYLRSGGDAVASGLLARAGELCLTLGREVRVDLPDGRVIEGLATALDADGRLRVGDESIAAGDVTHARLA
jgi:BirA family biotin operon repressor/biotin-[acetyl-CoA-carboxylase] ligase